jgi:tRNA(fMet)-specific endonuclease VapC
MLRALDTNTCVDFMRGNPAAIIKAFQRHSPADIIIPSIVLAELLLGAELSNKPEINRELVYSMIRPMRVVDFNAESARVYADIRKYLQREGRIIGPNDLIIAATAISNQAILVTDNTREFSRVPGLRTESWK